MNHLDILESQAIYIFREAVAQSQNPVMMYSIGKDSSVLLHLAIKAFYPALPPFPILHIDTGYKFREMIQFRDEIAQKTKIKMIIYQNKEAIARGISPLTHNSDVYTNAMKTDALKQALNLHEFDCAFGGARRDEDAARAKERIFSHRNHLHQWIPNRQRPELWNLYNGTKQKGESMRVFPLSNWTELDIWQYIARENIAIVPLYFAKKRQVIIRNGQIFCYDPVLMPALTHEEILIKKIRFRTLGCQPLTAGILSDAENLNEILVELEHSKYSERNGRLIDADSANAMENKKIQGYF